MAQSDSGIGNVTPNAKLVQMAMFYSRSYMLCAAARLRIADALGDEVHSVDHLAETCQADVDALYRLLRALANIGITEETMPKHFRLTPFERPLRRDVAPVGMASRRLLGGSARRQLVPAYRLHPNGPCLTGA
jgi:C-methyltransferase